MAALKADDIRPRRLMRDQTASMQADIAFLQGNRDRFVDAACPACDSSARRPLYRKYDLEHVVCDHCATQYIAPDRMPSYYRNSMRSRRTTPIGRRRSSRPAPRSGANGSSSHARSGSAIWWPGTRSAAR